MSMESDGRLQVRSVADQAVVDAEERCFAGVT